MHVTVTILVACVVCGCAAQKNWEKPGASQGEFAQDRYACMQASQQPTSAAYVGRYGGSASSGMATNDVLFSACMTAHGWFLQDKLPPEIQAAAESLSAQARGLCGRPDLQPYYNKASCQPSDITAEQMSSRYEIAASEKEAVAKVRAEVAGLNAQLADLTRARRLRNSEAVAVEIERAQSAFDRTILDLYEGRITWGDFNKRRQEVQAQRNREIGRIMGGG